jgi:YHS domain-containing protein
MLARGKLVLYPQTYRMVWGKLVLKEGKMFKKIALLFFVIAIASGINKLSLAADSVPESSSNVETKKAEDTGNKICPVSDEKIDEKTKATYEYKGKIYNFCCGMCVDEFKKDPEKYIKKVEEEMQKEKAEQKNETPNQMQGREMQGQEHN